MQRRDFLALAPVAAAAAVPTRSAAAPPVEDTLKITAVRIVKARPKRPADEHLTSAYRGKELIEDLPCELTFMTISSQ